MSVDSPTDGLFKSKPTCSHPSRSKSTEAPSQPPQHMKNWCFCLSATDMCTCIAVLWLLITNTLSELTINTNQNLYLVHVYICSSWEVLAHASLIPHGIFLSPNAGTSFSGYVTNWLDFFQSISNLCNYWFDTRRILVSVKEIEKRSH